jgi:hypothetical protein
MAPCGERLESETANFRYIEKWKQDRIQCLWVRLFVRYKNNYRHEAGSCFQGYKPVRFIQDHSHALMGVLLKYANSALAEFSHH